MTTKLGRLDVPLMHLIGWAFARLSSPARVWLLATLNQMVREGRARALRRTMGDGR